MTASKWRVVVADDEPAARRGVRQLLTPFREFDVIAECRDGRETLQALESLRPDVLFLDIQMPEIGGFEVLRRKPEGSRVEVVFLTAYNQFAIKAFEAEALDYLVKPVSETRFLATISRLRRRLESSKSTKDETIFVPTTRGGIVLPLKDIEWIESADNYCRIWTGTRSHLIRQALDQMEEQIGEFGFVRVHRQALVRIDAVRSLQSTSSGELVALLVSGVKVPISRRRRAAVRESLKNVSRAK